MKITKITKKIILITIILMSLISTFSFAAVVTSDKINLNVVEKNICTIKINDFATFEKKVIDTNLENKELSIQMKITNSAEPILNKPSEIFLVIDNSTSMKDKISTTSDTTRLTAVTDSAKTLANTLLENENVKIGVVSFSTGDNEGSITDAKLRTGLTSSKTDVATAITTITTDTLGIRTNIDAGLTIAKQNFSSDCENKFIILLTDGVPNTTIGGPTLTYSGETTTKTKATLQSLVDNNINILSVMTGVPNIAEPSTGISYKTLAEDIFGTSAEPNYGKFYYISDDKIETTICTTILSYFVDTTSHTLTNINIYDYFPQEIIDNFDLTYVTTPTLGTISPSVDTTNNCIIWHIDTLEPQSIGLVSYKLTLKKNVNSEVINIVLNTNKKVDITANEITTTDGTNIISSDVSPKVKLTTIEDTTVSNTTIPQTGNYTNYFVIGILLVVTIFIGFKIYTINKDMK